MIFDDTIVALVTPFGKSAVGIVRVSGKFSALIAKKILKIIPKPKIASYLPFFDLSGNIIDKGLAIWFPKPYSFTGEDVLELQAHGSPILLNLLINIIISIKGVRIAKKGEFTKRAFINNKINLLQAEAIDDLINAQSEMSLKLALKSLNGNFSYYINKIIKKIIIFRADIEARIDFLHDEDNYFNYKNIENIINKFIISLKKIINFSKNSQLIRNGIKLVISGPPNSGKSSLFNILLKQNRSIVTNIKGTTRDILNENVNINNILFQLIDTAGIHFTKNFVEKIGIQRTLLEIKNADFVFFVVDSIKNYFKQLNIIKKFLPFLLNKKNFLVLCNKCDLLSLDLINIMQKKYKKNIFISTLTGFGLKKIYKFLFKKSNFFTFNENNFLFRNRHIFCLQHAIKNFKKMKKNWLSHKNIELLAEDVHIVEKVLNEMNGSNISKKMISYIFSNFCIGK